MSNEKEKKLKKVFEDVTYKTHMPFFDGKVLLFCKSDYKTCRPVFNGLKVDPSKKNTKKNHLTKGEFVDFSYRPWKIHYCDWNDKKTRRLETGLPEETVECSPSMYSEDGIVYVSFIASFLTETGFDYQLMMMKGDSLQTLGTPVRAARRSANLGFVSSTHLCFGLCSPFTVIDRKTRERFKLEVPLRVFRLTFCAENHSKLIITGADNEGEPVSLIYDLKSGCSTQICASSPIYKSTVFQNQVIYATFDPDEDRELCIEDFSTKPYEINIHLIKNGAERTLTSF